ncbi:hypothetical protein WN55_02996 [Dufourea novaeangliae]|uniref:Uncharacterized protein n=1 Tax=Dufourea novaeangliae TaxID=178035 RepID=A0A154PHR4_DUFNO|nr:hypothetical protein WN55_02996 [Dufourea novaeangliae]
MYYWECRGHYFTSGTFKRHSFFKILAVSITSSSPSNLRCYHSDIERNSERGRESGRKTDRGTRELAASFLFPPFDSHRCFTSG